LAAAFSATDRRHPECAALLTSLTGRRLPPSPVLTEVCRLLERRPKAEAAFLTEVARGTFELVHLGSADLNRMGELILQHADFPLGGVGA
jgi:predicted nucleic acid-binding protein